MIFTDKPKLLPEEKKMPIAKYYDLPLLPPAPLQQQIINACPIDPKDAIKVENFVDLLQPTGYSNAELGCCMMPDGSGYIAAYTVYPDCTPKMLAWYFRFESGWLPIPKGHYEISLYTKSILPLCIAFTLSFHLIGGYRRDRLLFGFRALKKIVQGCIVGSLVFVATLYFLEEVHVSRIYIAVFTGLAIVGLLFERLLCHVVWKKILLLTIDEHGFRHNCPMKSRAFKIMTSQRNSI